MRANYCIKADKLSVSLIILGRNNFLNMNKFNETFWADPKFSNSYLEESDLYLPYRQDFIKIILSYCDYFFPKDKKIKFLELGCGDGYIAERIISWNRIDKAVLIDGSEQMLTAAKKKLKNFHNIEYKLASFQDLIAQQNPLGKFDFVFSSLAIHHLPLNEKAKLYKLIHDSLADNGGFINYDVVLSSSPTIESWHLNIWKNWILDTGQTSEKIVNTPQQYKDNKDNIPSSLEEQLKMLTDIGFKKVDCFFKFGIFSLFGGTK